ncbi:hypothetical protein FD755_009834, partial [Muntiacus reevesi]
WASQVALLVESVQKNIMSVIPRHGLETALVCMKDLPRMKDLGQLSMMIILEPQLLSCWS